MFYQPVCAKARQLFLVASPFIIEVGADMAGPEAKTIKKKKNSTRNKSQTQCARAYEVTSLLSTDCELSIETCSKTFIILAPCVDATLI